MKSKSGLRPLLDPDEWDNVLAACTQLVGGNSLAIYVKPRVSTSSGRMLTSAGFDTNYKPDSYLTYFEARSPLDREVRLVQVKFTSAGSAASGANPP